MTRRRPAGAGSFFDGFRSALARLPAGLIRAMPPASPGDLARAEAALARALPAGYGSFLRSFDGADLFHESVIIAGVGANAARALVELPQPHPGELVFAVAQGGDLYALDGEGRVLRYDAGADERALAGSSFHRWLDAVVARDQILFSSDGEYAADVFDPSGQEVLPRIALRQAERAVKADPGAADAEHARALALVRLGRREAALEALGRATELWPPNPWPWFDLGRTAMDLGRAKEALAAFRRAAEIERGPTGARLLAWATRAAVAAGEEETVAALRREASARDPELLEGLSRAARQAEQEGDEDAQAEALALLDAVSPGGVRPPSPRRLPIFEISGPGLRPPPAASPRRPRRGAPPRSGGSPRGSAR